MRPEDDPLTLLARVREQLHRSHGHLSRRDLHRLVRLVDRSLRMGAYMRHDPGCTGDGRLGRPSACDCGLASAAVEPPDESTPRSPAREEG